MCVQGVGTLYVFSGVGLEGLHCMYFQGVGLEGLHCMRVQGVGLEGLHCMCFQGVGTLCGFRGWIRGITLYVFSGGWYTMWFQGLD